MTKPQYNSETCNSQDDFRDAIFTRRGYTQAQIDAEMARRLRLARMARSESPAIRKIAKIEAVLKPNEIEELAWTPRPLTIEQIEADAVVHRANAARGIIPIPKIQAACARAWPGVTVIDILSSRRTADVVRPRQVSMYLCKILTVRSLPYIGRYHGHRDHTTVLHAFRKIDALVQSDPELCAKVDRLRAELTDGVNMEAPSRSVFREVRG
jgi:hypothetical protein